jgi:hypothetical protein
LDKAIWDLTCDFAEEIEEIYFSAGWLTREKRIPHSTSLRAGSSGMTTERQRLGGWWAVNIPPFAQCAKDGAPVLLWLVEEGNDNSRSRSGDSLFVLRLPGRRRLKRFGSLFHYSVNGIDETFKKEPADAN